MLYFYCECVIRCETQNRQPRTLVWPPSSLQLQGNVPENSFRLKSQRQFSSFQRYNWQIPTWKFNDVSVSLHESRIEQTRRPQTRWSSRKTTSAHGTSRIHWTRRVIACGMMISNVAHSLIFNQFIYSICTKSKTTGVMWSYLRWPPASFYMCLICSVSKGKAACSRNHAK